MTTTVAAPAMTTIPVAGGDRFPVRRIYCVGRNYAAHAREMGADPDREPPFFFMKPTDAVTCESTVPYPAKTNNYHHEIELVVALKAGGSNVPVERALDLVFGYAVGLDMTRRDLQDEAKALRRPWDMSKGFDQSAPCGPLSPVDAVGHLPAGAAIWLKVNDSVRQHGALGDMIWNVPEMLSFLSELVELAPGDIIFTGTPDGVNAVVRGDRLQGHVDGLTDLTITIK